MPRSIALGVLLVLVEMTAAADTDRVDLEEVRHGYLSYLTGALRVAGVRPDDEEDALRHVWTQLLAARVNRSLTDLSATNSDDMAGVPPAVHHALSAAQTLLSSSAQPPGQDPESELMDMRAALRHARTELQTSLQRVEDAQALLRDLGIAP
ncbi:hypothetical protein ACIQWR_40365 [Streptomyces sp. NPDC098789]|uniref:hypothetical protein n=1 Tax=Streptomyces sp. NPDC098789 TaxID=3366098 RepID=UPI00382ACBBB